MPQEQTLHLKKELKLLVVGSVGSGKTTSINSISSIPVIGTEASASERDAQHRKQTTTVAMEYGIVHLDERKIHLYGSPGQRRFDFMAALLCKGAAGMMVTIDNGNSDPLGELDYYLNFHGDFLQNHPAIIAVTHYDDTRTRTGLIDYHDYCRARGFSIPVMRMDARRKEDVEKSLRRLLMAIDRGSQVVPDSAAARFAVNVAA